MGLIVIFLLLIVLVATLPRWSYSKKWGYKYTGVLGVILAIVLLLVLMKIITLWDIDIETDNGKTEIEIERNY